MVNKINSNIKQIMGNINPEEILRNLTNMEGSDGYEIYNAEGTLKFLNNQVFLLNMIRDNHMKELCICQHFSKISGMLQKK